MNSDNMDNAEGSEASQNAVDLFSVYPAKLFHDLWQRSVQPVRPDGRQNSYEVIKMTRIYDAHGRAAWIDFTRQLPDGLRQWGSERVCRSTSLRDSNEIALRETHDLLVELRDRTFQSVVKCQVQENGCLNLRVNFGAKSYFTVRVHERNGA